MSHAAPASARSTKVANLKDRGHMLSQARRFFAERGILEVDVPMCTTYACIDENIDLMTVQDLQGNTRYLQSSPEYGMKRLLTEGLGDIYQIGHVFRDSEVSHKHNPEFSMAEWYRCGITYEEMIAETAAFIELFLGPQRLSSMSYRTALQIYAGIDYAHATNADLLKCLNSHGIELSYALAQGSIDDLLNIIMGSIVEPNLGKGELTALTDFPATQCALAEIDIIDGVPVAKRFEIYYETHELANGYRELRDSEEQLQRLNRSNALRVKKEKNSLPLDPFFLQALKDGLPRCCGVAVGFDRLMMLRHSAQHIEEVIPFCWQEA